MHLQSLTKREYAHNISAYANIDFYFNCLSFAHKKKNHKMMLLWQRVYQHVIERFHLKNPEVISLLLATTPFSICCYTEHHTVYSFLRDMTLFRCLSTMRKFTFWYEFEYEGLVGKTLTEKQFSFFLSNT